MWHRLPDDILERILAHLAAGRIARCYRRWSMRHVRGASWRALRAALGARLDAPELDVLAANAWVRREWRVEPHSWLVTLREEPHLLSLIVAEVAAGAWRAQSK